MRQRRGLLALALLSAALSYAAETPIPDSPTHFVTDTAKFLSPATVATLDARLAAYQQSTGHQLIIYIAPTTGDDPIDDWAVRAFKKWQVGRKGLDDGLALFIMAQDHKMKIEVGYGLEAVVPDAIASRILNEGMTPLIQSGHADDAVTAGVNALTNVISGADDATSQPDTGTRKPASVGATVSSLWRSLSLGEKIIAVIVILAFLLLAITHPGMAFFLLFNILSDGGGGGSGGGGGFSGGGGRSGGGGASGSW